jgi:hypothetical protein
MCCMFLVFKFFFFAKQIDEVGGKTHIKLGICTLTNKLCQSHSKMQTQIWYSQIRWNSQT